MWRDGYFYFDNAPVQQIMRAIGQYYNMTVVCANPRLKDLRMRFIAERTKGVDHVIGKINDMGNVEVRLEGGKIVLH